jgi:hypothetical protein
MNTEATNKGQEEVERLPAVDSDLENGPSGHGDVNNGRIGSGENAPKRTLVRTTSLTDHSERQHTFLH